MSRYHETIKKYDLLEDGSIIEFDCTPVKAELKPVHRYMKEQGGRVVSIKSQIEQKAESEFLKSLSNGELIDKLCLSASLSAMHGYAGVESLSKEDRVDMLKFQRELLDRLENGGKP